jgi:hypothetical protein
MELEKRPILSLKLIVRLLAAAGVLIVLFTQVSFGEVGAAMAGARPVPLLAALALTLAAQWATAWRLRLLTRAHGVELTTWQVLVINLGTLWYGLFLPGGSVTALAIRFSKLARAQQDAAGAGVSLLIDRVLATLALCFVGAGFWILERPRGSAAVMAVTAGMFAVSFALARVILARHPGRIVRGVRELTGRLTLGKFAKINAAVRGSRSLPTATFGLAIVISVAVHLVGIVVFYLAASAVGLSPSIVSLGWIRSAMILTGMVPITIAGLGVREGASLVLLAPYGVSGEQAVAFSLLVFAITALLPGLLGGILGGLGFVRGPASREQ